MALTLQMRLLCVHLKEPKNDMKKIAIYGAGGFGREIACVLNAINAINPTWEFIGFFDDGVLPGTAVKYGKVLGGIDAVNAIAEPISLVFSIANTKIITALRDKIKNTYIEFSNIFAPGILFYDNESFKTGEGNVILFNARISCDVTLGNFNLCNSGVSFGHDAVIGNFNIIGPQVRLSGNSTVGNNNFFGVQSLVLQGVKVGNHCTIGAGSVVMRRTKDGMLYFGNPAKKVEM
jgi:sugar O-acyltransferase (sialic acid O-acetyltransferase NeuD family)